jgi:peptidyl-prolyl cis-trans isomerase B (cyclophilin B)
MRALIFAVVIALQATPARPTFFTTPYSKAETANKQAVVETSMGSFVIELLPDKAPNHVGYFIKLARDGAYAGTTFLPLDQVRPYSRAAIRCRRIPRRPRSTARAAMNMLKPEINQEPMTAGAVAAVLAPGKPDSGGAQFFVNASDQLALQGQYTVFGRVVEGLDVVQQISAAPADAQFRAADRIVIKSVTIRDTPPVVKDPLIDATPADLAKYHAVLETTKGEIEIEFLTDKAPETTRQILRLAAAGVFDGSAIHRVVPNFVLQTGAIAFRETPLTPKQDALVHNLQPEFSDVSHVPGIVSMARSDDPASATTSFFICTGSAGRSTASTPPSRASSAAWTWSRRSDRSPSMVRRRKRR